MANPQKKYFLSPSFDYPPTGPILLGSILMDPCKPDRPLNPGEARVPPPPDVIRTHNKTNWRDDQSSSRNGRLSIWVSFLQFIAGIGINVGTTWTREMGEKYEFQKLETRFFEPDEVEGYLGMALKATRVADYLKMARFKKPVYLVIGVKIAHGAKVKSVQSRSLGGEFDVSVDGTAVTVPVSIGPQAVLKNEKKNATEWSGSDDFVFAYRLRRIQVKKQTDETEDEDYVKGALFGLDDDENEEGSRLVIVNGFQVDVGACEVGKDTVDAIDDDHEPCEIIVVGKLNN